MEEPNEGLRVSELGVGQCAWEHPSWPFAKMVSLLSPSAVSHGEQ